MPTYIAARRHHAIWYIGAANAAQEFYAKGAKDALKGLERFDRDKLQIEWALEWLLTKPIAESGILFSFLVNGLASIGPLRFASNKLIRWFEAERDAASTSEDKRREGLALGRLAVAYTQTGDLERAIQCLEKCLLHHRKIGDKPHEAADLSNLGIAYSQLGQQSAAKDYMVQALVLFRELNDQSAEGGLLCNLGTIERETGSTSSALKYYDESLALAREFGDWRLTANNLLGLGICYSLNSQANAGIGLMNEALELYHMIGDRFGEGNTLWNLALALNSAGDRTGAIVHAQAALTCLQRARQN